MPPPSTLLSFAIASLLLALAPGPSVVLVLAVGAEAGRRAATTTAVGLALGTLTWGVVVAAGLDAVLGARPGLADVLAALGGCYLLWLAAARWRTTGAGAQAAPDATRSGRGPFTTGLVVNLLNPSLALFLAAVLPPFLDPARGPTWRQVLALTAVLAGVSTVVNIAWGLLGALAGRRARDATSTVTADRAVAVVLAGLGVLALVTAVR